MCGAGEDDRRGFLNARKTIDRSIREMHIGLGYDLIRVRVQKGFHFGLQVAEVLFPAQFLNG
jgi:hypothetical protein